MAWSRKADPHLLDDHVSTVKESAVRIRRPRECKVVKAVLLPKVGQLASSAVDDKCNLVELDEFGVLRRLGVSDE